MVGTIYVSMVLHSYVLSVAFSIIQVGPFQASESEKHKVKVKLRLNLHGIISVESAMLIEDEKNESILRDTDQTDMDIQHESAPNMHFDPGTKIPSRRHGIPVREILYGGMSKVELSQAQEQEKQLTNQDKLMEQTKERKNALEAYVYEVRNKLFERYRSFASDSEREGISTSLQQTEDWLYEDGDDESVDVYISKLEDIKKIAKNPEENIAKMVKELQDREAKRKSFSRRRKFHEEKDVDSINDRNEHFNKKIERAVGKYTLEIKNNLERGTALPD